MLSVAISILAVGFLIFVHELGHFLACRATKTRVETFSIGFGPRLFGWERPKGGKRFFTVGRRRLSPASHAMDVRVAAIPLGGYVKMAGEVGGDGSAGDLSGEPRPPAPDEYPGKPFWARFTIIVAGVAMNALTAFLVLWWAFGIGLVEADAYVGGATPGGPAWDAGLRPGDRVLSLGGTSTRSFRDVQLETPLLRHGRPVPVEVERGGERLVLDVHPQPGDEGVLRLQMGPAASWTFGEGDARTTVGPADRVAVGPLVAVGGADAAEAVRVAGERGLEPLVVEVLDAPGRGEAGRRATVRPATSGAPKFGLTALETTTVAQVRPGSAAARAGLREGDRVVAVDGEPVARASDVAWRERLTRLEVRRGDETRTIEAGATGRDAVAAFLSDLAFRPADGTRVDPLQGFLGGRGPAAQAGVLVGDEVLSVDGKAVATLGDVLAALSGKSEVVLSVRTGDAAPRDVRVVARPSDLVLPAPEVVLTTVGGAGVLDSAALALHRTGREFRNIFRMIRSFFTGEIRVDKGLGGPGTLVAMSSQAFDEGFSLFLLLVALISVNLAVLNILPIPVLDGGQLLFLIVEKVRGRPLREATIAKAQFVGLVLLLGLMAFAIRNDFRLLGR
jgi:regulator of sigma E protease